MNLRDLRYLLAAAETGHFGRAAEACGISQPTLSVQLRKLEEELGVALFERAGKSVVPTDACRRLLGHVRAAVAEVDAILAVARDLRDPLAGRFRLGIIPTLAPYLLPLVFAPLREALPGLEIEPWEDQTAGLLARLRAHELDAALLATEPGGPGSRQPPAVRGTFPRRPAARTSAGGPADGGGRGDRRAICWFWPMAIACATRRWPPAGGRTLWAGRCWAASLSTLLNMVAAGYGVTLIPGLAAGCGGGCGAGAAPVGQAGRADGAHRLAARFPRREAVEAVGKVIADRLRGFAAGAAAGTI